MQLKWTDEASLRRLAEEGLIGDSRERLTEARSESLVRELLVHQAELEMQNEALRDAQAELTTLHERYKVLFDNAPTAYVALDASCRITAANDRAAKLLGETHRGLLGARLTRYLIPQEAIPFERYRREVMESATALSAEFTMVLADGAQREIRLDGVSANGDGAEWYVALTDVTAYNGMARKLAYDERLRAIQQRASTSTAFSRSEAARPGIADLNGVLAELHPLLPALLGSDIQAEVHLDASDGEVRLDRTHVEEILLTAVCNARQAMPHGGSFRIETATVELPDTDLTRRLANTRFVRWTLADTGVGMTGSTRDRAFEPFFTTKVPGVGTGLGLSRIKETVDRSGGFVHLESEPGRGTKLVIHLPRVTEAPDRADAAPRRDESEKHTLARILVVKDDAEIASEIASRLQDADCDVLCSTSGPSAIDLLRHIHRSLNVMLIDQSCPDFAVAELVRVAREVSPSLEIVVAPVNALPGDSEVAFDDPMEDAVDLALCAAVRAVAH